MSQQHRRLKKLCITATLVLLVTLALVQVVREFIRNDTVGYFAEQPLRLVFVAVVSILGGIVALVVDRLSPQLKRRVKLFALGSVASLVMLFTGYFLFELAGLDFPGSDNTALFIVALGLGISAFLWFEFYRIFKNRGSSVQS